MGVKVILSLDSEDYETPASDDAEKWWAETILSCGATASTCVVGELARALRERGRRDVLEAMSRLEVCYHSDMHSFHPTHAEYLDEMGWNDGVAEVIARESKGVADVAYILGQWPAAYCKPGNSWGPQVPRAMAAMGIPVFTDAPFEFCTGRPMWYDNTLFIRYHMALDTYFGEPHTDRLRLLQTEFLRRCQEHQEVLTNQQGLIERQNFLEGGYLVVFTHPCRLVTASFPGNFNHGNNPDRSQWRPAPLRPAEEVASLKEDLEQFIRWVASLGDVEICSYRELYSRHRMAPSPWLDVEELKRICIELPEKPTHVRANAEWLTPAELFSAVVRAALWFIERGRVPECVPVQRLYGPSENPPLVNAEGTAGGDAMETAVREVDGYCVEHGSLPASIRVGGSEVGPNSFMRACIDLLSGGKPVIRRVPEMPALAERPDIAVKSMRGTWVVFPPEFEGRRVLELARLHTWAAKPA